MGLVRLARRRLAAGPGLVGLGGCSAEAPARDGRVGVAVWFGGVVDYQSVGMGYILAIQRNAFRRAPQARQFALERLLDLVGIRSTQPILGAHVAIGPERCVVCRANFGDLGYETFS